MQEVAVNPFSAVQGAKVGHDMVMDAKNWAQRNAHLQLQQKQLEEQKRQHDEMVRQHNIGVGKQFHDMMLDAAQEQPGSPVQKAKIDGIRNFAQLANIKVDESQLAALKDDNHRPDILSLGQAIGASDPQSAALQKYYESVVPHLGQSASLGEIMKASQYISTANAVSKKLQATDARAKNNLDWRKEREGQAQYNDAIKSVEPMLNGSSRALSLIKKIRDPNTPAAEKIEATHQIRSILSMEDARLVSGKANFGEGTAADMAIDSYRSRLKDNLSKILDGPVNTISDANLNQQEAIYKDMNQEFMQAHDRMVDRITASGPASEVDGIKQRAQAFRDSSKKRFGYWAGDGDEKAQDKPADRTKEISDINARVKQATGGAKAPDAIDPKLKEKALKFRGILRNPKNTPDDNDAILKKAGEIFPDDISKPEDLDQYIQDSDSPQQSDQSRQDGAAASEASSGD